VSSVLRDADQGAITATGASAIKCEASAKTVGSSRNDKIPADSPGSLPYERALSRASHNIHRFLCEISARCCST
jgi:hypothetical protein